MTTSVCLSCAHYDDKPGLAGGLDNDYGVCRWALIIPLPVVGISHDLRRTASSLSGRLIPKRGLETRPDLWRSCPAHESHQVAQKQDKTDAAQSDGPSLLYAQAGALPLPPDRKGGEE